MDLGNRSANIFKAAYIFLIGGASLCILTAAINPAGVLQLYPVPGAAVHLYTDSNEPKGTSTVAWLDRANSFYECKISYGIPYPYCGMVIKFKRQNSVNYNLTDYFEFTDATTMDLSSYEGIYISLEYSGASNSLYFFARNAENLPKNSAEYDRVLYTHADFSAQDKEAYIDFSRMQAARWWIDRFDPPQNQRHPKFDKIYEIGIELPALAAEGSHKLKINRIFAKKQRAVFPLSNSASVYIMVLDLDHFKKINDTLGHAAGDEVLRKASMVLSKELRADDVFGRWGGEEFIIISRINREDLENMISRLMRSLQNISIDGVAETYRVTMSVGVTEAQLGESFDDVFKRADEAMYQVKQSGRDNWKLV